VLTEPYEIWTRLIRAATPTRPSRWCTTFRRSVFASDSL